MKALINYTLFFLTIAVFISIFIWSAYEIHRNWSIEKALDDHGVLTTGTIIGCNPGQKSTPLTFEYQVEDQHGEKIRYRATNQGGGGTVSNCKKGDTIIVRYLPENPAIARHTKNINISTYSIIAICSLSITFMILVKAIKEGINI